MLEVLPIQSKDEQQAACAVCGAEYDAELLAYVLREEGEIRGVCQFKFAPEGGIIKTLNMTVDDFQLRYMLVAGTFNFIDRCGVKYVYLGAELDDVTARSLGFRDEGGRMRVDLEHFFDSPCQHKHS